MKLKALNNLQIYWLEDEYPDYSDWIDRQISYMCWQEFLHQSFQQSTIEKYFNYEKQSIDYMLTCLPNPRTLDEFITLCQLAKIELYLKQ